MAGLGTATLPGARGLYIPLKGSSGIIGVIGVKAGDPTRFQHPEEMHLLEIFINQMALAIERAALTETGARITAMPAPVQDKGADGSEDVDELEQTEARVAQNDEDPLCG
jgi:GAF domain-containing protein